MAESQTLWADIERDLASATTSAGEAAYRDEMLRDKGAELEPTLRRDREYAIGFLLHNCYGAMESVLERLPDRSGR